MKKTISFLFIIALVFSFFIVNKNAFSSSSLLSEVKVFEKNTETDPVEFYKKQCAFCHESEGLIAPDMKEIKKIYMEKFPKKDDFIKAMLEFVKNPSKEKALYKKGLEKYTLMPKMPFKEEDLKSVTEYIYSKL